MGLFVGLLIGIACSPLLRPKFERFFATKPPVWQSKYVEDHLGERLLIFRNGEQVGLFDHEFDHFKFSAGGEVGGYPVYNPVAQGSIESGHLVYLQWMQQDQTTILGWNWNPEDDEAPQPFLKSHSDQLEPAEDLKNK